MLDRKEVYIQTGGKTNPVISSCEIANATVLDITALRCPMTFVRTRLALDRLPPGGLLRVRLRGDEPSRSVPEAAAQLGHAVLRTEVLADGVTQVLIRRA